jgi:hypothetical protein
MITKKDLEIFGMRHINSYFRLIFINSVDNNTMRGYARKYALSLSTAQKRRAVDFIKQRYSDIYFAGVVPPENIKKLTKKTAQRERALSIILSTI